MGCWVGSMRIAISPLYSSSKGNCTLVCTHTSALLTDVGGTLKATVVAFQKTGNNIEDVRAILITHEHSDHIKGVSALSRRFNIPVYATAKLWQGAGAKVGDIHTRNMRAVDKSGFFVGDIEVNAFPLHHDAVDPVGYTFSGKGRKVGLVTDTGKFCKEQLKALTGCSIVMLESNHDETMLKQSSYPYNLKKRILSTHGHLCNDAAAVAAYKLACAGVRGVLLAHLSNENNDEALAFSTVKEHLLQNGLIVGRDISLGVCKKFDVTGFYGVK